MEVYLAQARFEPATLGRQLWLVLSGIAKGRAPVRAIRHEGRAKERRVGEALSSGDRLSSMEWGLMRAEAAIALLFWVIGSTCGLAQPSNTLQSPSAFAAISDPAERSRAIFGEAAKVLTHPRCMNCHPATDRVLQGNDKHPHQPVATPEKTEHYPFTG
jgi:hypothetical protein